MYMLYFMFYYLENKPNGRVRHDAKFFVRAEGIVSHKELSRCMMPQSQF